MEPLSTFLSSLLGKVVAGSAVAAASVAGMNAADVVELPLPDLSETPAVVDSDATPVEPVTPAAEKAEGGQEDGDADDDALAEEKAAIEATADESGDAEATEGGEPNANAEFGQSVADLAQTEGTTGEDVSTYARENNPGVEAGQAGEVRQDGAVGQDDDAGQDAEVAEEQTPEQAEEPGSQADDRRPESAGSAAADAGARP